MAGDIGTYVLALRRELSGSAPADWQNRVRNLAGVSAGPSASTHRIQVEADAEALSRIQEEFGAFLYIERLSPRSPLE